MDETALFHHLVQLFFSSNHKYTPCNFYKGIQKALFRYYQCLVYFFSAASKLVAVFLNSHMHLYFTLIIGWSLDMIVFADFEKFYNQLYQYKNFILFNQLLDFIFILKRFYNQYTFNLSIFKVKILFSL
jgi:hypothetical protein